jgi:uncharacterized protein YndB with AHSA1/START domain
MSEYRIVQDYPYPMAEVWQVLTEPALVSRWTTTGQGGRPEGFRPEVGTRFRFVAKPTPGWRGIVDCEVLAVEPPNLLSYTWSGEADGSDKTYVTYTLEPTPAGTRFTWEHTGFAGPKGWLMSRLLKNVRQKMLGTGVPAVLEDLHRAG